MNLIALIGLAVFSYVMGRSMAAVVFILTCEHLARRLPQREKGHRLVWWPFDFFTTVFSWHLAFPERAELRKGEGE